MCRTLYLSRFFFYLAYYQVDFVTMFRPPLNTFEEAKEDEGLANVPDTLRYAITAAPNDNLKATYWVIVDGSTKPFGDVSALKEWSD